MIGPFAYSIEARWCRILVYSLMNSITVSPPSVTMASTFTTQTMLTQCHSRMNTNTLMHMKTDKHLPTTMHTHAYNDQNIQHIYTHTCTCTDQHTCTYIHTHEPKLDTQLPTSAPTYTPSASYFRVGMLNTWWKGRRGGGLTVAW